MILVYGNKPLVGLAKEVQAAFEKLKKKFGVKEKKRRYVQRTASVTEMEVMKKKDQEDMMRFRRGTVPAYSTSFCLVKVSTYGHKSWVAR